MLLLRIGRIVILGSALTSHVAMSAPETVPSTLSCTTTEFSEVVFDRAKIEALTVAVDDLVGQGHAPGAVLLVEQDGKIVVSHASGFADLEERQTMQSDALFRLYSMTKPITSVALLALVERGLVALDDQVARYLPEFAETITVEGSASRPLLVSHLLTHEAGFIYRTSTENPLSAAYVAIGIPAGPGVDSPPTDGSTPVGSLEELSRRLASLPLVAEPGTRFTYGNATDVAGRLVEVVHGKPLRVALDEMVLEPLGMEDTAFVVPSDKLDRLTSAYAAASQAELPGGGVLETVPLSMLAPSNFTKVDDDDSSIFSRPPQVEFGGAGLVGTASDYLRFTQAIRQGGEIDGKRVLSANMVALMSQNHLSPNSQDAAGTLDGLGFGYGFAIRLEDTQTNPVFPQCGYFWAGAASTYFWIDPIGRTSGVLMTQVFGGDVKSHWLEMLRLIYAKEAGATH